MRIEKVTLQSKEADSLAEFYGRKLGFPVVSSSKTEITFQTGESSLIFEIFPEKEQPCYHFAFNIPSNGIESARDWLAGKVDLLWMEDYQSEIAEFRSWHARALYFYDPAGNIVEFIARTDRHDMEESPFQINQVRSISEIGLVFPSERFDDGVTAFMKGYSLNYFDKQEPLPHFRAIGDDEGLFIVVPDQRSWYPTRDHKAGLFPLKVDFSLQTGQHSSLRFGR